MKFEFTARDGFNFLTSFSEQYDIPFEGNTLEIPGDKRYLYISVSRNDDAGFRAYAEKHRRNRSAGSIDCDFLQGKGFRTAVPAFCQTYGAGKQAAKYDQQFGRESVGLDPGHLLANLSEPPNLHSPAEMANIYTPGERGIRTIEGLMRE